MLLNLQFLAKLVQELHLSMPMAKRDSLFRQRILGIGLGN